MGVGHMVARKVIGGKRELSLTDIRAAVSELGLLAHRSARPDTHRRGEALVAGPRPVTAWQPDRLGVHRAVQEHDATSPRKTCSLCWTSRPSRSLLLGDPLDAGHDRLFVVLQAGGLHQAGLPGAAADRFACPGL